MFPSFSRKCFKTGSMPIFSLHVWSSHIQLLPQTSAIIKLHINMHTFHAIELARSSIVHQASWWMGKEVCWHVFTFRPGLLRFLPASSYLTYMGFLVSLIEYRSTLCIGLYGKPFIAGKEWLFGWLWKLYLIACSIQSYLKYPSLVIWNVILAS